MISFYPFNQLFLKVIYQKHYLCVFTKIEGYFYPKSIFFIIKKGGGLDLQMERI